MTDVNLEKENGTHIKKEECKLKKKMSLIVDRTLQIRIS